MTANQYMRITHFLSRPLAKRHAPHALRPAHNAETICVMKLEQVIQKLRRAARISQTAFAAEVAELSDTSLGQSDISRFENGEQRISTDQLEAMAKVLKVSPADIYMLTEYKPDDPKLAQWLRSYGRLSERQISLVLSMADED